MKTLVIVGYGVKLRYRNGVFQVINGDSKEEASPLELEQIVIASSGVSLTSKTIRKIIEYGIDLVFLDSKGMPVGRVYPPFINKTVDTRRKQYKAYGGDIGVEFMKSIVWSKLLNQAGLLKRYYHNTKRLDLKEPYYIIRAEAEKILEYSGLFDEAREYLRQREAYAARIYWDAVATLIPRDIGFDGRDPDSIDPFNISLNYGYGILYKECWKALVLAGLDPYAGFMHVDHSGKPVLVYDFIEQFRFIADYVLIKLFRRKWVPSIDNGFLTYDSRIKIIKAMTEFMENTWTHLEGSKTPYTLRQVIKKKAFELASYLRGSRNTYEGYVWDW